MAGPDKLHWEVAGGDEITRLIESLTAFPIPKSKIPANKWRDIVYYNPVVRQNLKDGRIEYRVRGTAGGNLLTVLYDVSARTANLEVVKILIHATCSANRKWMTIDIKDFYLGTPLPPGQQYEYMRIHKSKIPAATMLQHNLGPLMHDNYVYFEIRKCLYGIPQSGKFSQDRLVSHLAAHGYTQCPNTPCLFNHATRDITFSLVVDDFGVSYSKQQDVDHLIAMLKANNYLLTIKEDGNTYLGMKIRFDTGRKTVSISMPGYLQKALTRFRPHYLLPGHRAAKTPGQSTDPKNPS